MNTVKERPILMCGEMVMATLDGRKTQTRRPLKFEPEQCQVDTLCSYNALLRGCPYGQRGDHLWVRETFWENTGDFGVPHFVYKATPVKGIFPWTPSTRMPRRASRITLEIISVRVERLQEISARDCEAEGLIHAHRGWWVNPYAKDVPGSGETEGADCYRKLWNSINAKTHPWASNPFVWVIKFKRL